MGGSPTRILHTCLEPALEGTAPRAHCEAVAQGLQRRGWSVVEHWNTNGSPRKARAWSRHWWRTLQHLRHVDAVYCRWHVLDLPTHLLARLSSKRLVLEVNGGLGDIQVAHPGVRPFAPLLRLLTRIEFRLAHSIICVSPGLHSWARQIAPARVDVSWARNGADVGLARRRKPATRPPFACFIGALAPWQGIELLLDAAASPDWPLDVHLHVAGDGRLAELVRKTALDLPHVHYHGRLPRERALELLASSSVSLCIPSSDLERNKINGIPFKLAESLMLGVPVVASPLRHQVDTVQLVQGGVAANETAREVALAVGGIVREAKEVDRAALSARSSTCLSWDAAIEAAEAAILSREDALMRNHGASRAS